MLTTYPSAEHGLPLAASFGGRVRRRRGKRGGVSTGPGRRELVRARHATGGSPGAGDAYLRGR